MISRLLIWRRDREKQDEPVERERMREREGENHKIKWCIPISYNGVLFINLGVLPV